MPLQKLIITWKSLMLSKANNRNGLSSKVFSVVFLVIGLQGCTGGDMSDLQNFVATAHQDKKPEIEPLPEIPPFKAFEYLNEEATDPFSTENIVSTDGERAIGVGKRPDQNRRRQALEKFPLDALRLAGTITKDGVPHVVVKTNDGSAILATIGNYMGQNDGKIREIIPEEQRVVLVETVLDPAGRWVTRDVEITIDEL